MCLCIINVSVQFVMRYRCLKGHLCNIALDAIENVQCWIVIIYAVIALFGSLWALLLDDTCFITWVHFFLYTYGCFLGFYVTSNSSVIRGNLFDYIGGFVAWLCQAGAGKPATTFGSSCSLLTRTILGLRSQLCPVTVFRNIKSSSVLFSQLTQKAIAFVSHLYEENCSWHGCWRLIFRMKYFKNKVFKVFVDTEISVQNL